jgi:DNA-binding Lrp family transcriptional regulator
MGNPASGRKGGSLHRFYLIKPRPSADADKLAERLIALKPVEEVFLADGDYGFIVKVKFLYGEEPADVVDYLKTNVATGFSTVDSYYRYRK